VDTNIDLVRTRGCVVDSCLFIEGQDAESKPAAKIAAPSITARSQRFLLAICIAIAPALNDIIG
jgi:hypothetical protein